MAHITAGHLASEARKRAALSQRELAERAGTTQAGIARIEAGDTTPSFETLRRLVNAAGFDLRVELMAKPAPDPLIAAYKCDVDTTLLLENLRKTPEQRSQTLTAMARLSAEMARARRAAARKR